MFALVGAGCGGGSAEPTSTGTGVSTAGLGAGLAPSSHVHLLPMRDPSRASVSTHATTSGHLNYYGGKVLSNVKVIVVFWGGSVAATTRSGIGGFFTAVTNSAYFDWLSEYNTTISGGTQQTIGRGSLGGQYTITPSTTSTFLTDAQIQTELNNQINAGHLPAPDANTLYMTYFPSGVFISAANSVSCVPGGFCAYHGTFNGTKGEIYYGVLPDVGSGSLCNSGCGGNASSFNNLTSVSSHEMIEATTDAEVGLSSTVGPPLAWYDSANGEIGDLCNAQQGSIVGYVVQKEWDNASSSCIVSK